MCKFDLLDEDVVEVLKIVGDTDQMEQLNTMMETGMVTSGVKKFLDLNANMDGGTDKLIIGSGSDLVDCVKGPIMENNSNKIKDGTVAPHGGKP